MPFTQPHTAQPIHIYRDLYFSYTNSFQSSNTNCKCACDASQCTGAEKLMMQGTRPSPVNELYNYFENQNYNKKGATTKTLADTFPDDSWSTMTGDQLVNVNMQQKTYDDNTFNLWERRMNQYSSACVLCNKITLALQKKITQNDFAGRKSEYDTTRSSNSSALNDLIGSIHTRRNVFLNNTVEIKQLQKKIRLSHQLLNAQAQKLKSFGLHFTSLQAQYKEREMDRVSIGIPYLKPFYTMTSRQFFLMMVVLNIVLAVGIGLYGFYPRSTEKTETTQTE